MAPPSDVLHTTVLVHVLFHITSRIQDLLRGIPSIRHPTEKLSDQIMHFFTPELYMQFNSSNDEIADQAEEAWESALQDYQHHLEKIRPKMIPQVSKISELNLHDAEILKLQQDMETFPQSFNLFPWHPSLATMINLRQGREILSLVYMLHGKARSCSAKDGWHFSRLRRHWLYDEIDMQNGKESLFVHRILFSDGSAIEIPFFSVIVSSFRFPEEDASGLSRQIA